MYSFKPDIFSLVILIYSIQFLAYCAYAYVYYRLRDWAHRNYLVIFYYMIGILGVGLTAELLASLLSPLTWQQYRWIVIVAFCVSFPPMAFEEWYKRHMAMTLRRELALVHAEPDNAEQRATA